MGIKKKWVSWEEFEVIQGGTWTPSPHTHVKADITDTPWAWSDVLKTGASLADLPTRSHSDLQGVSADQHHAQLHEATHRSGGGDELNHDNLAGFVAAEHKALPNTIAQVLSDHNKAAHDALGIDAETLDSHDSSYFATASHLHDDRYYTETEVNNLLAQQDTLAEMGDVQLQTLSDGQFLMYDAELAGGKWTNKTLARADISDFWGSPFWANIPDKPSTFDPVAHALVGAKHTASGLTTGHFLKATGPTTFAFAAHGLTYSDVGAAPTSHTHDDRYYTESEVDNLLAQQDTLAEMGDVQLQTLSDEQVLVYDADLAGGKWTNKTLTVGPHATQHESGGSDTIDFNQITGFSTYLDTDNPVKKTSNPIFNSVYLVNTDTRIAEGNYNMPRLITPIGYVDVGVKSTDNYAHIDTGATRIVLNQAPYYNTYKIWHENNDGPGSGLNADLVDGENSADIVTNARVKAHFPDTIANILSNHTKAVHDALGINADLWDGHHLPTLVAGKFLSNDGSNLSWETPAGGGGADLQFRAYRNTTSQSVGASQTVKVQFNAENYDPDSKYDPSTNYRYSPASAGYYNITATIYTYLASGKIGILYIYKNGSEIARYRKQVGQSAYFSFMVSTHYYLGSSDYIEIYYYNGDTSNRDIFAGSNQTWFCAYKFI